MVETVSQGILPEPESSFRPAKRRKFYRKRNDGDDSETGLPAEDAVLAMAPLTLDELVAYKGGIQNEMASGADSDLSVAEIMRRRKVTQRKREGIEFTNAVNSGQSNSAALHSITTSDGKESDVVDTEIVAHRFAPQTGQVADVDKHMMAYIDSEMAKFRKDQEIVSSSSTGQGLVGLGGSASTDLSIHRQPAALGKLLEIDLGPDATLRNIERTKAAHNRLEGGLEEVEESTGKVRLRRDGKPWRGRRRRNSEDVKRDQLVEEVLRESRLEIYDEPEADAGNDDQAADDRVAEQFRREFLDAISSRRQRTGTASGTKSAKGAKVDEKPKGPKLGGSRSARAAMREQQEKAMKK